MSRQAAIGKSRLAAIAKATKLRGQRIEMSASKALCDRVIKSYGVSTVIINLLTPVEALKLQGLDRRMRDNGVGRVQTRLHLPRPIYFSSVTPDVYSFNHKKALVKFTLNGPKDLSNKY